MQWDDGPNAGFSTADPFRLYLPVDPDPARPTVAAQEPDPHSTLNLVRRLVALRKATPALGSRPAPMLHEGYPLAYVRGDTHLVVVNPRASPRPSTRTTSRTPRPCSPTGCRVTDGTMQADGFAYGIFALSDH